MSDPMLDGDLSRPPRRGFNRVFYWLVILGCVLLAWNAAYCAFAEDLW